MVTEAESAVIREDNLETAAVGGSQLVDGAGGTQLAWWQVSADPTLKAKVLAHSPDSDSVSTENQPSQGFYFLTCEWVEALCLGG